MQENVFHIFFAAEKLTEFVLKAQAAINCVKAVNLTHHSPNTVGPTVKYNSLHRILQTVETFYQTAGWERNERIVCQISCTSFFDRTTSEHESLG